MSDDTTTWLKKNPSINPLRRSLKASLRFHVPSSDMNASIVLNPNQVKDQGLFIPRMLQKSNVQMRKSRAHEFKVPELLTKPATKKEGLGSGTKHKKIPTPKKSRKSLLPVPKTKRQMNEKITLKTGLPRPSFVPGASGRRTTAKRELIKKVVELSEIKKREEAESQLKPVSGDSSVIRSILKKRASLRRTSQISLEKPKAKKVLFDGFESSDGEKENTVDLSVDSQNDFNKALDEPTVFLNFRNGANVDDSPYEPSKPGNCVTKETESIEGSDVGHIVKLWESYKRNFQSIQTERSYVESSFESFLEHSLNFQKQYQSYKENSEEMYRTLTKLGQDIEENLKKLLTGDSVDVSESDRFNKSSGRRTSDKSDKIKILNKSKAIKKNSVRKSVPLLKKEFLSDMEDSFVILTKNSFLEY